MAFFTASDTLSPRTEPDMKRKNTLRLLFKYNAVLLLVVMIIVASIISDVFLSFRR